ncbi:MAG TPA: histidine ammonia-lyase [Alphaproteobacteria bacterium]|nr:histidine ammonia-lyase [Alphaproteobacteria bacterium]
MAETIAIEPGAIGLGDLRKLLEGACAELHESAWPKVAAAAATVARLAAKGQPIYGVNTGFGKLSTTHIPDRELAELQRRLLLSHMAGVGEALPDRIVHAILVLKAAALARGHSGCRRQVIDNLLALANAGVYPIVPAKGSVGASGDLAPLAHLSAALIGFGEVRFKGVRMPAGDGLAHAGLVPMTLGPKEGLALINGTQVSTALALAGLFAAEDIFAAALVSGALSVDASLGADTPFDPRIHAIRGQPGQIAVAGVLLRLLEGSEIRRSHLSGDERVQDPYSLRCQPQVMGACLDNLRFAADVIGREANGVSDNPLVFPERDEVISGGNFHAEPVAMAADVMALALAEIGAIAERRVALLTDANLSFGLPPFLVREPGLNSGFMLPQVTAAALVSENRALATPSSVDSLPTSANQEDHVSMATYAARRTNTMAENSRNIVAIEILAAVQGIELRRPLKSSARLEEVVSAVRARVGSYEVDRPHAPDIASIAELIEAGRFREFAGMPILP